MNIIECPHGCGRKFQEQQKLDEHVQRRHIVQQKSQLPSLYENMKLKKKLIQNKLPQLSESQTSLNNEAQKTLGQSIQLPPKPLGRIQLNKKSILRPSSKSKQEQEQVSLEQQQQQKIVRIIEPNPQITTQELLEAKKQITKAFICTNSDGSDLSSVTQLSLNDKGLLLFESTKDVQFSEFISLKSLSLSQNKLINIIGLSEILNLIELNINQNFIVSLQPLSQCKRLQKLLANDNQISQIDLGLMIHLKIFQIGNNQLNNFEQLLQSIRQMPSIKDLVIENNPCTQKYAYKYDILQEIIIDKLDNKIITQQDYNLSQAFKETKQDQKLSQSSIFTKNNNRPQTANQSKYIQEQDDNNSDIIILQEINQELEEEVDQLYDINQNLREKVEKLENQNIELRQEAEKVTHLENTIQNMQNKISAYETLSIFKDSPIDELRKYLFTQSLELEKMKQLCNESGIQYEENVENKLFQSKLQQTETTIIQQLSQNSSQVDDDDDDKYFRDDEGISYQTGQELMELVMRNSMTLSKMKDEFKELQ